jgi:hypothetical protein
MKSYKKNSLFNSHTIAGEQFKLVKKKWGHGVASPYKWNVNTARPKVKPTFDCIEATTGRDSYIEEQKFRNSFLF